jgi:hypothetical protein
VGRFRRHTGRFPGMGRFRAGGPVRTHKNVVAVKLSGFRDEFRVPDGRQMGMGGTASGGMGPLTAWGVSLGGLERQREIFFFCSFRS